MANDKHPLASFTVHLDDDFAERIKNAAHARGVSAAAFCAAALIYSTMSAERDYNGGQPFPQRPTLQEIAGQQRANAPVSRQ